MIRVVVIGLMLLGTIGYEPDFGTGGYLSQFQNTWIIQDEVGEDARIEFEFLHTYQTSFTLTIRLTNSNYSNVLLYTQRFSTPRTVQRILTVPRYLLNTSNMFDFSVQHNQGSQRWNLLYETQAPESLSFVSRTYWESQGLMQYINGSGQVTSMKETLRFTHFSGVLFRENFGYFNLNDLSVQVTTTLLSLVSIHHAYLLIAASPYLIHVNAYNEAWKIISLIPMIHERTIRFSFRELYVHPFSLYLSDVPLPGFVPTRTFFFPHGSFARHHITSMELHIRLQHVVDVSLTYRFTYQAHQPLFGSCQTSLHCVRVAYA
jgi:hypothetical protein